MNDIVEGSSVTVKIGGEAIAVPPMNFAALKQAWPSILSLAEKPDAVGQAESVVEILAASLARLRPELTKIEIEARLVGREFLDLVHQAPHLLHASGLAPHADAPAPVSPSPVAPSPVAPSPVTSSGEAGARVKPA